MYKNFQKDFDECQLFVKEGIKEEYVSKDMVAQGPTGHLYVAVSNLLDYALSELNSDEEIAKAVRLAKKITELS